ncbi:unnamed protein product [Ectocarpus sp. 13 AM-2016]
MPDSAPPVCENCKPGKATDEREAAIEKMDCQASAATYDLVAACMEAHRGNVADCRTEWNDFTECHQESRRRSTGDA